MKTIVSIMMTLILSQLVWAQDENDSRRQFNFFKGQKTFIRDPFKLRDPFKRNLQGAGAGTTRSVIKSRTNFSNVPDIGTTALTDIQIIGIYLGENRRAMARTAGQIFILKEGMKIGRNQAEIKAILPGGIVVVERIRNVYDQDEVIETILPLIN